MGRYGLSRVLAGAAAGRINRGSGWRLNLWRITFCLSGIDFPFSKVRFSRYCRGRWRCS